jgi:hypothetical protein
MNNLIKGGEIHLDDSAVNITNNGDESFTLTIYSFDKDPYEIVYTKSELELLSNFIYRIVGEIRDTESPTKNKWEC